MELPRISLDDVKSRLGFSQPADSGYGRRSSRNAGYDDYADDYADDYGSEYADDYSTDYNDYSDNYDNAGYDAPGSLYEPYNQVTTRSAGRRSSSISAPRLVSATDVRASTHLPVSETVRPVNTTYTPSSSSRRSSSSFRTLIDNTAPAPSSPADVVSRKERSESLNGLFGDAPAAPAAPAPSRSGLGSSPLASAAATRSYDPYESYSNNTASTTIRTPSRGLEVIKPQSYNDVERVAKILRAGDVAIIALNATPADLSKRILDFSFGVASALDATVDLAAPKVYVITTGQALSDAERMKLRGQGVM